MSLLKDLCVCIQYSMCAFVWDYYHQWGQRYHQSCTNPAWTRGLVGSHTSITLTLPVTSGCELLTRCLCMCSGVEHGSELGMTWQAVVEAVIGYKWKRCLQIGSYCEWIPSLCLWGGLRRITSLFKKRLTGALFSMIERTEKWRRKIHEQGLNQYEKCSNSALPFQFPCFELIAENHSDALLREYNQTLRRARWIIRGKNDSFINSQKKWWNQWIKSVFTQHSLKKKFPLLHKYK